MRPLRFPAPASKPIALPGLFCRGLGFVHRAGQLRVSPLLSPEIMASNVALGLALRPSLYVGDHA